MEKRKYLKRIGAVICCAAVLAGTVACSSGGAPASSSKGGKSEAPASTADRGEKLLAEPLEIELLFSGGDLIDPDGLLVQEIEKKTNVKLKLNAIPTDYETKRSALLASNDIPDAVWCGLAEIKQYAPMGMFLKLSDYEADMPNYSALINAEDRKESTKAMYLDGALYGFARLQNYRVPVSPAPMIRMDLLEKNNIPVPATYEELFDVFMKLKEIYPDKYILSSRQGTNYLIGQLAYPMGSGGFPGFLKDNPMYYEPKTESYQCGPIHENFKVVLEYLNRLYENKLLDPDYATNTEDLYKEKLSKGSLLFFYDNTSHAPTIFNPALREIDPDARLELLPVLKNSFGDTRAYTYQKDWLERNNVVINANVDRPNDVVRFFDWFYSEEGSLITNFGIEGETYVLEDGKPVIAPAMAEKFADTPKSGLPNAIYKYIGGGFSIDLYRDEHFMEECADEQFMTDGETLAKEIEDGKIDYMRDDMIMLFTNEEKDKLAAIQANVMTVFNGNIDKFITGVRPVSEFDAFVEELKAQGAEELEEIYNAAYARMK